MLPFAAGIVHHVVFERFQELLMSLILFKIRSLRVAKPRHFCNESEGESGKEKNAVKLSVPCCESTHQLRYVARQPSTLSKRSETTRLRTSVALCDLS
jgi:hypothetical protein